MSQFKKITAAPPDSKFILQGNAAFALGVVHAGYHAARGACTLRSPLRDICRRTVARRGIPLLTDMTKKFVFLTSFYKPLIKGDLAHVAI